LSVLKESDQTLPGFATLDFDFVESIGEQFVELETYIFDNSRKRPHNVLLMAPPGSGKSRFIKCLAEKLNTPAVIGNLSVPDPAAVLSYTVNEARNYKAQDRIPLIFLDEVDSHHGSSIPLLLPLLWDGELAVTGQVLQLGRCIIICAVSDARITSQFSSANPQSKTAESDTSGIPKLPDFLSRFGGGLLYIKSIDDSSRRFDKLCIAAQLLRRRFQEYGIYTVPIGLLQFLCQISVQHEARSIESIINMLSVESIINLSLTGDLTTDHRDANVNLDTVFLPLKREGNLYGPLQFHIKENAYEIEALCDQLRTRTALVPIVEPSFSTYTQEYEALRRFIPQGGPERTFMMMALVTQVQTLAKQLEMAPSEVNHLFNSGGEGNRIVALEYLIARPSSACFDIVFQAIGNSKSGFEQSAALRAAERMLPSLDDGQKQRLPAVISENEFIKGATDDRRAVSRRILDAIKRT
jgi:hypothetical protein